MAHPHEPRGLPAERLKPWADALAGLKGLEAHPPVREAGQGPVGEGDDLVGREARVVRHVNEAEVEVAWIARRAHDPPVLPLLGGVAHRILTRAHPGPSSTSFVAHVTGTTSTKSMSSDRVMTPS